MRFKPTLIPTLAAIIVIALMMKLGFWQLHRAEEKAVSDLRRDIPAQLSGTFLTTPLIIHDNRIDQGQAGYHLLAVFQPKQASQAVLVNLGWQSWPQFNRRYRPKLALPSGEQQLKGVLHKPIQGVFTLAKNTEQLEPHFILIETLDIPLLSRWLRRPLQPVVLQLDADTPPLEKDFRRHWLKAEEIGMTPEKHRGYAFQWFIMAAVVFGLYIGLNIKRQ